MLISIVMPIYNAESTLKRSIDSVLKQSNPSWELICVDDGSEDNSLSILKDYAKRDVRIKVFHKENSGPGLSRNYAMEKCSGDYIGYLDADDIWNEECVDKLIKMIENYNADVIVLRTIICANGQVKDAFNINQFKNLSNNDIVSCMMSGILPWGQEKVIRASIIRDNNLTYSDDEVGEEAIFSFEVMRRASIIEFIDYPMYYYYASNGQHKKGSYDPWFNIVKKMKHHLYNIGLLNEFETSLNSFALRALAISAYRISISHPYKEAKTKLREKLLEYEKEFDLKRKNDVSLDKKTKIVYWLLKKNIYFLIYLLSKHRNGRR